MIGKERRKGAGGPVAAVEAKRVDIAAVEQTLKSHPAVFGASVRAAGGGRLHVTVTLKGGYQATEDLKTEMAWLVGADLGSQPIFEDIVFRPREESTATTRAEAQERGDFIYTSGHRIDLSEVESTLLRNENVTRAVVTGVPDARQGEILRAWVSLRSGCVPNDELKAELAWFTQVEIGPMVRFQDIEFGEAPAERGAASAMGLDGMVVIDGVADDGEGPRMTGHRISTTEVARVLLSHPDIADAAVVTVPDDGHGEVMKAFARVRDGVVPTNDLKLELAWLVLTELRPVGLFRSIELEGPAAREAGLDGEAELARISGQTALGLDVEEALERHPAVAEAIVIGVPDAVHGEALQAFVNLAPGVLPSDELRDELAWHARAEVGERVVFRGIKYRRFLPGGKDKRTVRRILRADALDIPTKMDITIAD